MAKFIKLYISARRVDGDMATNLLEDYQVAYTSIEEIGNDGDLAMRIMEKLEEVEEFNKQESTPF